MATNSEVLRENLRERRIARNCAETIGHVNIDSPICDACGWDVRKPIKHDG